MPTSPARERAQMLMVSGALVVISIAAMFFSRSRPWTTTVGSSIQAAVIAPVLSLHRWGYAGVAGTWNSYLSLVGVETENKELRDRIAIFEQRQAKMVEALEENRQLKKLLGIRALIGTKTVGAPVLGFDPSPWVRAIVVGVGRNDGVVEGAPVYGDAGLAGQIIQVTGSTARVRLVVDLESRVDAIVQGGRAHGVIRGDGSALVLDFVEQDVPIAVGDVVVTSGFDGVYPKGVRIGVVQSVEPQKDSLFLRIEVMPAQIQEAIEYVLVSTNLAEEENTIIPASVAKKAEERKK